MAQVSDAGMPVISDPGADLVRLALSENIPVIPLPGPNAALTALVASGLDARQFVFIGFLPKITAKQKKLLSDISRIPFTLIFYEALEGEPSENYGKGIQNVILTGNLLYIFRKAESETLTIHHIDTGDSETYSFDQMNERLSSLKTEAEDIPEEELKKAGLTRETRILQVSESTGVWFAWNGEIYNAVNREYTLEEGKAVSGGHIRKLKLSGGRADLEDEESVTLDWSRMKTGDGRNKTVQASGSAGNRLYLSVTDYSNASELISFNLLSGESTEETPADLYSFEVLGEDKLVICRVSSEGGWKNTYSIYNRETGSSEELLTLTTETEDPGDSAHYDEKNDIFYYSRNGEIFAVRNRNPEQAEAVNTDVLSSTRPFSMQLEDGRLAVWKNSCSRPVSTTLPVRAGISTRSTVTIISSVSHGLRVTDVSSSATAPRA